MNKMIGCMLAVASMYLPLEAKLKIDANFIFDFMRPPSNVYYVREHLPYERFHFTQPFFIDSTRYSALEMQEILLKHANGQGIIMDTDYSPRDIDQLVGLFHSRITIYADRSSSAQIFSWLRMGAQVQVNASCYSIIERRRMERVGARLIFPNNVPQYGGNVYIETAPRYPRHRRIERIKL